MEIIKLFNIIMKASKFKKSAIQKWANATSIFPTVNSATPTSFRTKSNVDEPDLIRYLYTPNNNSDLDALDDIEKNGYIILDENEDECWIDVIHPDKMKKNLGVTSHFDDNEDDELLHPTNYTGIVYASYIPLLKTPPPIESNLSKQYVKKLNESFYGNISKII